MTRDSGQSPDDAAIEWFVILRDEDVTALQRRDFATWLAASPEHAKAWAELERLWVGLDALAPTSGSPGERDISVPGTDAQPAGRAAAAAAQQRNMIPLSGRRSPPAHAPTGKYVAIAASVLAAAVVVWQATPVGLWADHRTGTGEQLSVALADGSSIELNSSTALDVEYSEGERRIRLLTGEAFFTVAKDASRPFIVSADGGEVVVRGTAFNVRIGNNVAVAVTENVVEVEAAGQQPVRVAQGEGVSYTAVSISPVAAVDLDTVQAWRQHQLVFHDARLADVLDELQRYRRGYVRVLDASLNDRRVTAVFDTRRPDAALETIARNLDLRLYRLTDLLIGIGPGEVKNISPSE
ncbi:FecR family protein [Hyphomicrobium sp. D-2]|uniref:FecR family protein n=1 Tax=Hyphomicrobium sp. D-2 TaxID=3041621 RepID=UPI0024553142|nr:FecR family protein [Hyphomicrobium sp. D-2]MDH4981226.1 FecR family protein [Hyphomicrobium sp. D-2]